MARRGPAVNEQQATFLMQPAPAAQEVIIPYEGEESVIKSSTTFVGVEGSHVPIATGREAYQVGAYQAIASISKGNSAAGFMKNYDNNIVFRRKAEAEGRAIPGKDGEPSAQDHYDTAEAAFLRGTGLTALRAAKVIDSADIDEVANKMWHEEFEAEYGANRSRKRPRYKAWLEGQPAVRAYLKSEGRA